MTASKKTFGPSRYGSMPASLERNPEFTPSRESGLDLADLKIMDVLVRDGRANNRSMTEAVGLSEETVAARIRNMIDRNIIGITAIFDWSAAGFEYDLYLRIECAHEVAPVAKALAALDEVVFIYEVLGSVDLIAHALLRDRETMLEFVSGTLPGIAGIAQMDVALVLDTVKFFFQFANIPIEREIELPDPVVDLNDLDWKIIKALVANGRASNREIARSLSVSDGTIRSRIRRMEEGGLLQVRAQVHPTNSQVIGARNVVAIAVQDRDARYLARELAAMPEVLTVSLVAGQHDIICYVATSSRERMVELLAGTLRSIPGVRTMDSYEVISAPKANGHWARW